MLRLFLAIAMVSFSASNLHADTGGSSDEKVFQFFLTPSSNFCTVEGFRHCTEAPYASLGLIKLTLKREPEAPGKYYSGTYKFESEVFNKKTYSYVYFSAWEINGNTSYDLQLVTGFDRDDIMKNASSRVTSTDSTALQYAAVRTSLQSVPNGELALGLELAGGKIISE
jgi:hypothetical protein